MKKTLKIWYHTKIKKDAIVFYYTPQEDFIKTYGKIFSVDLIKCCLLLGLIIPCGIEYLIIAVLKKKGINKEFFRLTIKK